MMIAVVPVLIELTEITRSNAGSAPMATRTPASPSAEPSVRTDGEEGDALETPEPSPTATALPVTEVVVAVGDLTECPNQDQSVPSLASRLSGRILAAGDLVDPDGSVATYESCHEPLWES